MCHSHHHGHSNACRSHYGHARRWKYKAGMGLGGWLLTAAIFMWVWNAIVPPSFGGPALGYFQAVGLLVLGRMLTGGFRHSRRWRHEHAGHPHDGDAPAGPHRWRKEFEKKMEEKMAGMSPEEREQFRKGFASGKWDVNVFEVEDDAAPEPPKPDGESGGPEGDRKA
ncbi:MAG: hypothetical protein NW241_22085 [Bacteroidia bacterium]|nr:hypothetical protein [Bacteroidia bacterium]